MAHLNPGPEPEGSPEAMRGKASELKSDASRLRDQFAGLASVADGVEFEAEVGRRWRHEMHALARHARTYADQADHLAGTLIREAGELERRKADWQRRFDAWIYDSHPELRPPEHPPGHPDQAYA